MDINGQFRNPAYPARPGATVVMSTFWLLRDLEATTAEFQDMSIDKIAKRVTLLLSMSKNDPRALGCERTWGCICDGDDNPAACPYHAALDLDEFIRRVFPHDHRQPGFPLFPTEMGEQVTSEMMLTFIEELAFMMGEELFTKAGQRRFGKHSRRSTGAVHLALIGLDTFKVQLIGRWLCAIVMRYSRLAPIADVARDYRVASSANKTQDELNTSTKLNLKLTKLVEGNLKTYADDANKPYDLIRQVERQCAIASSS